MINSPGQQPLIVITHDEGIFSANDRKKQAQIQDNKAILWPKSKRKGIMVSNFLLLFSRLNLFSLPEDQQNQLISSGTSSEAVIYFEYGQKKILGKDTLTQSSQRPSSISCYSFISWISVFIPV